MKLYNKKFFEELEKKAQISEIKRSHFLMHDSHNSPVQRFFMVMLKDSFAAPHYHPLNHQWELVQVIEGAVEFVFYDEQGNAKSSEIIGPSHESQFIEIDAKEIHSLKCLSERAVLIEIKEGPFDSENAKVII